MQDPDNLSALYRGAIQEDQRQRSENLILAIALHKPQHNVTSMQLKAVDVTNVAVMTISSRTALLIEIMTRKTVVLPMVNRNITMITDQN